MKYRISKFIRFFWAAAMFVLVAGIITMVLWNWLIPDLFAGPYISLTQAIGLLVLSKIFFGGMGGGGWKHRGHMRKHWRKKWQEKMANMSEDDREKFKSRFCDGGGKWGNWKKWSEDWEVHEPGGDPDESETHPDDIGGEDSGPKSI